MLCHFDISQRSYVRMVWVILLIYKVFLKKIEGKFKAEKRRRRNNKPKIKNDGH